VGCVSLRSRRPGGRVGGAFVGSADGTQRSVALGQEQPLRPYDIPSETSCKGGRWRRFREGETDADISSKPRLRDMDYGSRDRAPFFASSGHLARSASLISEPSRSALLIARSRHSQCTSGRCPSASTAESRAYPWTVPTS
jgi:hypothetical protein